MSLPYQIFVGLRYLRAKRRHRTISVNTAISIAGVALGVTALVTVLSVMTGFQEDLRRKILGVNAHVVVMDYGGVLKDADRVVEALADEPNVLAWSPFVLGQVMLSAGKRVHGVVVRGIDPARERKTTDLLENLVEGSVEFPPRSDGVPPGIILGKDLARTLGVGLDDDVKMISPLGALGPMGMLPRVKTFRVTGVFEAGMFEYDANLCYIDLPSAQSFLNMDGGLTGIELKLDDVYAARDVAERLQARLGFPFYARDWVRMNKNLFAALKLEKMVMFVILTLIVLVAAFNIVGTLVMIVIEKSRDIAILKTMGATNRGIMAIFMTQGVIVGLTGTVLGLLGGFALCLVLGETNLIALPGDVYYLDHLPVIMKFSDFAAVAAAAMAISFLATVYPSYQAAKMDPVEPLRYE